MASYFGLSLSFVLSHYELWLGRSRYKIENTFIHYYNDTIARSNQGHTELLNLIYCSKLATMMKNRELRKKEMLRQNSQGLWCLTVASYAVQLLSYQSTSIANIHLILTFCCCINHYKIHYCSNSKADVLLDNVHDAKEAQQSMDRSVNLLS